MFASGFTSGELFPRYLGALTFSRPAEIGVGLPFFAAKLLGMGRGGDGLTYEYGYTFCIVAGLLNMLIMLDAYDIAVGRKS
jgi:hypothetical protein